MVMLFPHSCLLRSRLGFTYYDYPGIYNDSNFHHCGLEPDDNIVDYNNEVEVWTCQLEGLAECVRVFAFSRSFGPYPFIYSHAHTCASLATDTEFVRVVLAGYTNHLLSLGVDGLRLDAAKSMSSPQTSSKNFKSPN